jgi:hypothetical protein
VGGGMNEGSIPMDPHEFMTSVNLSCRVLRAYVPWMPTLLRSSPYRIYFHRHEPNEPPHVHVDRDACSAKFWLAPVRLARNLGFAGHELRKIEGLIRHWERIFLETWYERFGR